MVEPVIEQTGLMSIEEFVRLYETEGPFELINGERRPLSPVVAGHGDKARKIYDAVAEHNRQTGTGIVYFELAYILTYSSDWVTGSRTPDVMFYNLERMSAYQSGDPAWEDKPFVLVPDLVVEVISRNDSYTEVDEKVDLYLQDGVKMVWVLDPRRKVITVRGENTYAKLTGKDTLTGGDIIPDFALAVNAIFE